MLQVRSFMFNPVGENTYILFNDAGDCCIIDPGCYFPEEREELRSFVSGQGLRPVLLLNTHCHLDHVFGNKFVHDTWGLTLHIHEKEKKLLEFAPQSGQQWGLPFENYEGPLAYLEEGDTVSIGEEALTVLFVPGHAPGHLAFYHAAGGFVIGGDVLFQRSIGRTDLPGGDTATLLHSIRTKLFTLPDETLVYSGHGPVTSVGSEKRHNPFLQ